MNRNYIFLMMGICIAALTVSAQQSPQRFDANLLNGITYRNMGPYRTGAWAVAAAVPESPEKAHRTIIYGALRSGGVWKSSNGGVTFEPVMDSQNIYSMGAIAVAPSDANVVWAGTGDNSATRSAYWGDGVYKSTNGGETWQNMGLKETHHIARIVIHPTRPDTVWVAALGHLATDDSERGVFKTTDGGKSWKKVLYVNDRTGAVDLVRDPRNPEVLYAATYEHQRFAWVINDGGPGTGIYKTTDGGANWVELLNGLPKGPMGRIGIDICRSKPDVLYAVYDNHNLRPNPRNDMDTINGQVYRTDDAGASWGRVNPDDVDVSGKAGYSFNQITVDPNNADRVWITGSSFQHSSDGGKTWRGRGGPRFFGRAFGDFRSLWVDPEDSDHMIATSDGGLFQSFDGGMTNEHLMTIRGGEVYAVGVDMDTPYNIYAGLQDHESWKGPSNGWAGSISIGDWVTVGTGDGMYNQVDPTDSRWVYNTQEFGSLSRYDQKTHERIRIQPTRTGGDRLRINWIAPFIISPHDPKTLYAGAQLLFKSTDRGDSWREISPDLTNNYSDKINRSAAGSAIVYCDVSTISESPVTAGIIWVGTDDGKVQLTRNDGGTWTDVTRNVAAAGGPENVWVSRVFASRFDAGTAYVAKTGRRQDVFKPFLFRTTDFGSTWKNIAGNLPQWPINSILEDLKNPSVLFAGTDIGVYTSIDGGARWVALKSNMAPAAVTDMVIHPREQDLVAGTYGRGVWVVDIAPIREMTEENLSKDVYLFAVKPKPIRVDRAQGNYRLLGDTFPSTPNEPNGLLLYYYLKQDTQQPVTITIANQAGQVVRTFTGPQTAGLHRGDSESGFGGFGGGGGRGGGGRGGRGGQARGPMPPGDYAVTLQSGETRLTQQARILPTPEFR